MNKRNSKYIKLHEVCNSLNIMYSDRGDIEDHINNVPIKIIHYNTSTFQFYIIASFHSRNINCETEFSIHKESTISGAKKLFNINDILTGDNDFDKIMLLKSSNPTLLHALLDSDTRNNMKFIAKHVNFFEINKREFKITISSKSITANDITTIIKFMADVCNHFNSNKDIYDLLRTKIKTEFNPSVCISIINYLVTQYKMDDELKGFLYIFLKYPNYQVQAVAAINLSHEGFNHLSNILPNLFIENTEILNSVINHLCINRHYNSIPILKKIYHERDDVGSKILILNAFYKYSDTSLSSFLIEELKQKKSKLTIHILNALSTCGDVSAIDLLYSFSESSNNKFTDALNNAIVKIQSRIGKAEKGWLSINNLDNKDGMLSVFNEENGKLSILKK